MRTLPAPLLAALILLADFRGAAAITITGYQPSVNDRFVGGFPAAPVANTTAGFIGLPYDWSGVGWASASPSKGFGFVTPRHYLVARHVGGAATISVQGRDGLVHTGTQQTVTDTGYGLSLLGSVGDLSVGRLTAAMPADRGIASYAVLDLHPSSTADTPYDSRPLLVTGKGTSSPRIGPDSVTSTTVAGQVSYFTSSLATVQLEIGDSGSPVFVPWTDPDGGAVLALVGNNAAVGGANFHNFAASSGAMRAINAITVRDGFVLRMLGDPAATWLGGAAGPAGDLGAGGNWSPAVVPTDHYAVFDGAAAATRLIEVDGSANLRGLSFRSTGSGTLGFTFAHPANVLTVGRGGIVNLDVAPQAFTATLALGDHQFWDVGPGGLTTAAIDTRGRLLEIAGSGTAVIAGSVVGTGGIALSGRRLELAATNGYSGATWVHAGTLVVSGTIASSSGIEVAAAAVLAGTGGVTTITGAGSIDPGDAGAGILAATSVDPSGGIDFAFEFTRFGSPDWAAVAASGNDVLRLTGTNPFAAPLSGGNVVNVFLDFSRPLAPGDAFRGGFFTVNARDFRATIADATFAYWVADPLGTMPVGVRSYAPYTGPLAFAVSTVAESAGAGEAGFVLQFRAVPEPPASALLAVATAGGLLARLRRRYTAPT
jgi:autotransporter-associated beta strand protein